MYSCAKMYSHSFLIVGSVENYYSSASVSWFSYNVLRFFVNHIGPGLTQPSYVAACGYRLLGSLMDYYFGYELTIY